MADGIRDRKPRPRVREANTRAGLHVLRPERPSARYRERCPRGLRSRRRRKATAARLTGWHLISQVERRSRAGPTRNRAWVENSSSRTPTSSGKARVPRPQHPPPAETGAARCCPSHFGDSLMALESLQEIRFHTVSSGQHVGDILWWTLADARISALAPRSGLVRRRPSAGPPPRATHPEKALGPPSARPRSASTSYLVRLGKEDEHETRLRGRAREPRRRRATSP